MTKPLSSQTADACQNGVSHTPGPWEAAGSQIVCRGAWRLTVAILPTTVDPRPTPDAAAHSLEERDANAKLIASAPELLMALQLCLALHSQPAPANVPGFDVKLDPMAEKQVRAAIEKATGVQS